MKHFYLFLLPIFTLFAGGNKANNDLAKVSEAFGHLISKNIETLGVEVDLAHVIKGLQDSANGKQSPMTEVECIEAISSAQEIAHQNQALQNLESAEKFLKENEKSPGIVSLEKGLLQYKIDKEGSGDAVKPSSTPLIRYTGRYLDGTVFGSSSQDDSISLDESIQGFQKGLVGMREGEKRTLYIHPDYGYGTNGYLPPNSLLTFEIKIVQAKAHENAKTLVVKPTSEEAIVPDLDTPALR